MDNEWLSIDEIHEISQNIVNYSPDSCLVLLDMALLKIEQLADEDLAEAYMADNNLRRADFWVFDDTEKAERYLDLALGYYIEHVDNKRLAEIYCLKGQVEKMKGQLKMDAVQSSLSYFNKAIEYALKQDNPNTKAFIYYEKALTLQQTERWHESLENALQNLHFAELSGDSLSIAMAYFLMGRTYDYFGLGDYSEASMANAVNHGKGMSLLHSVVHTYANILVKNGKNDLALENYKRALRICEESGRLDRALVIYTSLGILQLKEGKFEEAEKSLAAINRLSVTFNHLPANTMYFKAQMHYHHGDFAQVLGELEEFNKRYGSFGAYAFDVDVYKGVASLYSALEMPEKSAMFYKKWGDLKDSLQSYTNRSQLGELKKLYLNERSRNAEILAKNEELKKRRASQAGLGGALIVFVLIGGGVAFYMKTKALKDTQSLKLEFKARQLEQLIEVQESERQHLARELHDGVGQSLAALKLQLQFGESEDISNETVLKVEDLCKEVRTLSHQMMPLVLRENGLNDAIKQLVESSFYRTQIEADLLSIGLNERLPDKVEIHLYRISQELISNILKHSAATKVGVQLLLRGDVVILIVEDNGKGFDESKKHSGVGISNIYSRVESLSGAVNVQSSPEDGTYVHVEIPVKQQSTKKNSVVADGKYCTGGRS